MCAPGAAAAPCPGSWDARAAGPGLAALPVRLARARGTGTPSRAGSDPPGAGGGVAAPEMRGEPAGEHLCGVPAPWHRPFVCRSWGSGARARHRAPAGGATRALVPPARSSCNGDRALPSLDAAQLWTPAPGCRTRPHRVPRPLLAFALRRCCSPGAGSGGRQGLGLWRDFNVQQPGIYPAGSLLVETWFAACSVLICVREETSLFASKMWQRWE